MSNGGGAPNTAAGATGNQPVTAGAGPSTEQGSNAPQGPGGKGGFPSAQSPYSQQPQVYMPPQQPTFYDQVFSQQYYQPQQQYYQPQFYQPQQQQYYQAPPQYYQQQQPQVRSYGLGSLSNRPEMGVGNAYARRPQYSPPSPIEALPLRDDRRYVPGGLFDFDPPPRQLMSDSWGNRPRTNGFGNNVPEPMPEYRDQEKIFPQVKNPFGVPVQPSEPVMQQQGANISNPNRDRAREINMRSYNNPSSITAEDMAFLKDYDAGRLY